MVRSFFFLTALLIAALVPVQMTIGQTAQSVGLRVNAADLVMPFAVLSGVWMMWRGRIWPQWRVPHLWAWLTGLSLIMIAAFLNGLWLQGELSHWALVNRLIGWFILMGFLLAGGLTHQLSTAKRQNILQAFLLPLWVSIVVCGLMVIIIKGPEETNIQAFLYPLQCFMGDRNALAILFIAAFILNVKLAITHPEHKIFKYSATFAILISPVFFYLNYSLSGMITLGLIFVVLLIQHRRTHLRWLLLSFTMSIVLLGGMLQFYQQPKTGFNIVHRLDKINGLIVQGQDEVRLFSSDNLRLETYTEALARWRDHPILGIGLGGFMQGREQAGLPLVVLDSTPLWLLTEMGLLGLGAFVGFGVMILRGLWRPAPDDQPVDTALRQAGLLIVVAFVMMSSILQLLYLRPLWFLMGLILAKPNSSQHNT